MTFSAGGTCSAMAALVSPILGRSSKMSTSPRRSPSTSTVPFVGKIEVAATWSSVVLPAPFGPMRIQRSSSCAVQSMLRSRTAESRRTSTPRSRSTSSDISGPLSPRGARSIGPLVVPPRPNLRHGGPSGPAGRDLPAALLAADRDQRGLGAVLHAELGQHRAYVGLDRLLRDTQRPGDFPVGAAFGQLGQDLPLTAGEGVQAAPRPAGRTQQVRSG